MIPGENIISGKASVASVNRGERSEPPQQGIYGVELPKKIFKL